MALSLVGCNHESASLEVRERLAISASQLPEAIDRFKTRFPESEAVFLSTCNRTEIYTAPRQCNAASHADVIDFLAEYRRVETRQLSEQLFARTGQAAVQHLFAVACSLDSMVIGETQILAQVKDAYRAADRHNATGRITHAAFQAAIRVARRVATETEIHRNRISVASLAVREYARQIFERLDNKLVLVIGAGKTCEETLRCLAEAGASRIFVVNRNAARGQQLAGQYGGMYVEWNQLTHLITQADLVVSATSSTEPLIDLATYRGLEAARYQRPQLILDLAVPRDFDTAIGDCLGVYLYSLDDLQAACQRNRKQREYHLPAARRIISEETLLFMSDMQLATSGSTIRRLREHADGIKHAEVDRVLRKLPQLGGRDQATIRQAFDRLVNKLLHPALESLREEVDEPTRAELLVALCKLFQIADGD